MRVTYFISKITLACSTIIFLFNFTAIAQSKEQPEKIKIDKIDFGGLKTVDAESLSPLLSIDPGLISIDDIDQATRSLYSTGFFNQVHVSFKPVYKEGKTVLSFDLQEKPVVRKVFVEGNKNLSDSDLSEILTFKGDRFYDKKIANDLIQQALMEYQSKGYYDAQIEASDKSLANNLVDVTFTIKEGSRFKITEINVKGLENLSEGEVKKPMQTKEYAWWKSWLTGSGRLNKAMLDQDKQILRQYLVDQGYVECSVSDAEIEKVDQELHINFDVKEGKQYSFGEIQVKGDLVDGSAAKTLEEIGIEKDKTFSGQGLRDAAQVISDKFANIGHAFVNVVPETAIDRENLKVPVQFTVSKGKLVSIDTIKISGNRKTYDNVIRREMVIQEQELFSGKKVKRSEDLLKRLGYFEEVSVATEPVAGTDDKVDLNVNVREGATGSFSAGAGLSSQDGAVFNIRLAENNFMGAGRSVNLNIDIGTQRDNIVLSLDDRRLFDSHWAGGVDLLRTEREFEGFNRTLSGGGLVFGYPLDQVFGEAFEDWRFSTKYEYLNVEIDNISPTDAAQFVVDSAGTSSASGVTPKLTRSTIDNPLNPTKGSRQTLAVEATGLGGTEEFYLIDARNQWYKPIIDTKRGPIVFSVRTGLGYGKTYDGDPFPLFRRFFAGGINSVRGFKVRELGPKDAQGREYGGSQELINNTEVIFPLVASAGLRGVVFYDIGNAFDDDESMNYGDLRHAAGAGIRWASPLGPIRIEFGKPLDRKDGESGFVTLFSFGAPL
jgi:outer membrane protein insertion porin family